ncbi:hypothetical protein ACKKBF_B37185 [Auxenochlorella protothecoides x Auxenochlorella symbiontica]
MDQPAVELRDLTFTYPTIDGQPRPGDQPIVRQLSLQLPRGSCTLLLGANGAGKTTLLRVLAGKHMVDRAALQVMGEPPFHATHLTTSNRLSYIGGNWDQDVAFAGYSQPLRADISAGAMLENVRGVGAARRAMLLEVMDINPAWRMHLVSDGQRRRVQIAMGLLHPFEVLLLDEVTVDLDVLARSSLMAFLRRECRERQATVVYATHIFDGLDNWPTHILFLSQGQAKVFEQVENIAELKSSRLMTWVVSILRAEKTAAAASQSEGEGWDTRRAAAPKQSTWNNGYIAGRLNSSIR